MIRHLTALIDRVSTPLRWLGFQHTSPSSNPQEHRYCQRQLPPELRDHRSPDNNDNGHRSGTRGGHCWGVRNCLDAVLGSFVRCVFLRRVANVIDRRIPLKKHWPIAIVVSSLLLLSLAGVTLFYVQID